MEKLPESEVEAVFFESKQALTAENQKIRKSNAKKNLKKTARYVAETGILAALLTGGKFALSWLPNIEIVTTLILVYGTVLGLKRTIPITLVFCCVEFLIYGFSTWVVLYFVYWNLLGVVAALFLKDGKTLPAVVLAVVMTAVFGVLSTGIDVIFASLNGVSSSHWPALFAAYYTRGAVFFVIHIVSNFFVVLVCYKRLVSVGNKVLQKNEGFVIIDTSSDDKH